MYNRNHVLISNIYTVVYICK